MYLCCYPCPSPFHISEYAAGFKLAALLMNTVYNSKM